MYFSDHNPFHFHVRYNEYRAVFDIYSLNVLDGYLPGKVRGLVQEWAEIHQEKLLNMWQHKIFYNLMPLV